MICTFFGHRYTPDAIEEKLEVYVEGLITQGIADRFYVGNHGEFDAMALRVLRRARKRFPNIKYAVVLAYAPTYGNFEQLFQEEIYLPDGMENVEPRSAIIQRNHWMVNHSDMVVCYITKPDGGAAMAVNYAKNQNKTIHNIADINTPA